MTVLLAQRRHRWTAWLLLATAVPGAARAQEAKDKDDDELRAAARRDPFTGADAAAMAAAGIVAYAPFPWADHKSTADIDRVLGEDRVLWVETAHLRIGCNLRAIAMPLDRDKREPLIEELAQLKKKLPKVPARPKRLDPWLRLHVFAQRAEQCYTRFQGLIGATDTDFPGGGGDGGQGSYLGMGGKFLLLLFQKKSDLARYLDRFCGLQTAEPTRHHHATTSQLVAVICCEGFESFDDAALHRYTVHLLMHNFVSGYRGFFYQLPLWFDEGLAHWFAGQVESNFVPFQPKAGEAVTAEKMHLWAQKVRLRVEHPELVIPFATMAGWSDYAQLGYQEHVQSWSRVDYLMQRDETAVGVFLKELKSLPPLQGGKPVDKATVDAVQTQLLAKLWQLDAETFDTEWRQWVLKTYARK